MSGYDFDIGILGGGAAGLTVASGAAQLGAKTLLIDKEKRLGGDCLHYGCVPSKALIATARVRRLLQRAADFGLPAVEVPPADFREVAKRIRSVIGVIQKHDSEERFSSLGVAVRFGEAQFVDDHELDLNGKGYSAKTWVIATGSSPSIPPIQGLDTTPFLTNREIFSLNSLPKSLIILGGGPVAVEMAQAFCRLGTAVTVIEQGNQILNREDRDMADLVMNVLRSEGVLFYLRASALSARDAGNEKEVAIRTAEDKTETLRAEAILVATGRDANVNGLGLEKTGIEFSRKGIKVDNRMRTTRKHIYAAGDVTGAYQFTHAAGYEAGIIVSNAVFHLPRKADYTFFPWCTYTDPELASIGMNEGMAKAAGIPCSVWTEEFSTNDRGLAEGEETGRIKLILDRRERPLGIQILGPHAGELISEWVAIANGNVGLSTLAGAIHPYPTLAEINKKVAGALLSKKIFSDRVKKALKLFFRLKGAGND
jgi:pyruvate/2-oxoglutarate dehydrogenase complex dihydrolipoamide dehydrogenase (E3) component